MDLWAGHGTRVDAFKEPLPRLCVQSSPHVPSPAPATRAKRHTDVFHEVRFTVIKEEGLHIRPLLTPPSPVCLLMLTPGSLLYVFAGWGRK